MKFTFKDIEEGIYKAKVSEIKKDQGPFGPFFRLTFTIVDGELKNYRFPGFVKSTALKQSKFYRWATHILGEKPDDYFDTKDLIGKHCLVLLAKSNKFYSVTDVYRQSNGFIDGQGHLEPITPGINKAES